MPFFRQAQTPPSRVKRRLLIAGAVFAVVASGAVAAGFVLAQQTQKAVAAKKPMIERDVATLPASVARMRERIVEAAQTGDIEKMRIPLEVSELPPLLKRGGKGDPLALLKGLSADAEGREILARLINVLEQGYAVTEKGTVRELFVFPWFSAVPFDDLAPADLVEVYRIVPAAVVKDWREKKIFTGDRLAIGKDGTWHHFLSGD